MLANDRPLVEYDPENRNEIANFRCGNNYFVDDVWDFKGFVHQPQWNDAKYRLDFTPYHRWGSIKTTIKQYIAAELLANTLNTVRRKLDSFVQIRKYLETRPDILSFEDFNKSTLREYFSFLLEQKSERGTPLSGVSIKKSGQAIKEILVSGAIKGWQVPEDTRYVTQMYEEMIIENNFVKQDTKFGESKKVLPEDEIVSRIIDLASKDEDILTGASIILSTQLGLRISEVVTLQAGCLQIVGGEYQISYTTSKTVKQQIRKEVPANKLVVNAVKRLEEHTRALRERSGLPYLFLTEHNGKIVMASYSNWEKNRLRPFIEKHDLRDKTGGLLKLTQHYFRHIFITYAIKNGMKIHDVADMVSHKSIQMTEVYNHAQEHQQEQAKKILSGEIPVSGTNKMVLEAIDGEQNPFRGKTTDQVDKLRRAMKIEILPHGVCLHHPLRGEPCAQDGVCLGCNHFLAAASMLPQYEARLERVTKELESAGSDNGIYVSKLKYQAERLSYYVKDLSLKVAEQERRNGKLEVSVDHDAD